MGGFLNSSQQTAMIREAEERGATAERKRICALLEEGLAKLGPSGYAAVILTRKIYAADSV